MDDFNLRPARDLGLAPFERLKSVRRESGPFLFVCQFLWGGFTRIYFRTWHRLTILGREHLPVEPPFVICANHSSHLDSLALASPLRLDMRDRVFSLAAGDVFFESAVPTAFAAGFINALPVCARSARRAPCKSFARNYWKRRAVSSCSRKAPAREMATICRSRRALECWWLEPLFP